ncbi:MAG: hypothetical protein MUF49_11390 [Oculatellaceae cyanobacterium Prado106]|jgi:hypothetical protein|nr:hypothetical protein [Oculatellaceae cyanobacterium Prado106]
MFALDQPSTPSLSLAAVEASASSSPQGSRYSIRTIKRDLKILSESELYYAEITVSGGTGQVSSIDMEDFCLPQSVLQTWKTIASKKQAPQVQVFQELAEAIKQLDKGRQQIYRDRTVNLHLYRTIPGSQLEGFMEDFDALRLRANVLLAQVLESHAESKARFLNDEIQPLLQAGYFSDEETRQKLAVYANRFPKLERIQVRFGVQLKGPFRMQTWREALEDDTQAQRLLVERDRLAAQIAQSMADKAAADQQMQQVEQERRAYQMAYAYQQQQIRTAIDSKVTEVRHQVLDLLHRSLRKLVEKDYQPGKVPPGLRQQLTELAESATLLSQTDQSLAEVVAGLGIVNQTARLRTSEPEALRSQVDDLLAQLEHRLRVPALEVVESLGSDDRASWLKFA